ncbi:MAG: bifunctional diaminohydroxyphosphoribosylaminopyrimidine deaminase/5-amino-6-(5-phosphoribosylamino)uracil reductase RibD [Pseudohongiellaceae bacterium]
MQLLSDSELRGEFANWANYMRRALDLAAQVIATHPNPRVGCVLVQEEEVVAEGWHIAAGEAHAEVMALQAAGERARGSTAFITLEPCSHTGKTGPCTDALIKAGVHCVVIAGEDPNPEVAGAGVRQLEEADIEVFLLTGFTAAAETLNKGFLKRHRQGLPFVRCKLAMSLDGRTALANGESKWITDKAARSDVQRLRAASSAIITGIDTVLADNPALTVRKDELVLNPPEQEANRLLLEQQPMRVILDTKLRTPVDARILQGNSPVRIYCGEGAEGNVQQEAKQNAKQKKFPANVQICPLPLKDGRLPLPAVLESLARDTECNDVLIETGPVLAGAFMAAELIDELIVYIAPKLLGSDSRPLMQLTGLTQMAEAQQFKFTEVSHLDDGDIKLIATPNKD